MKRFLLISVLLMGLLSCKKDKPSQVDNGQQYDVSFGLSLYRQDISPIGSMPKDKMSSVSDHSDISAAPIGEIDPADPNSGVDFIYYYVFKNNNFVKNIKQTRATEGFGKIVDQLAKGTYTITVVASKTALQIELLHKGEPVVIMGLPGTDIFQETLNIDVDGKLNRVVYLRRPTALLKITTDDIIPIDVKSIQFSAILNKPNGDFVSNYLRLRDGQPAYSDELAGNPMIKQITEAEYGKPLVLTAYIYGTTTEFPQINISLSALNSASQAIYSVNVPNVEMENGKQTNLKGPLFNNILLDGATIKLPSSDWQIKGNYNF